MRRRSKYALAAIIGVAAVIVFAVVPVVFWFNAYSPVNTTMPQSPIFSVHRSMSCVTLGFGVTYKSAGQYNVWYLGCDPQILVPV